MKAVFQVGYGDGPQMQIIEGETPREIFEKGLSLLPSTPYGVSVWMEVNHVTDKFKKLAKEHGMVAERRSGLFECVAEYHPEIFAVLGTEPYMMVKFR